MPPPVREVDFEVLPQQKSGPSLGGKPPTDAVSLLLAKLMDSLFKVPGTNIKIGLDPLIGLIPGIGAGASALISFLLIARAALQSVPGPILARMVGNVLINAVLDSIPLAGDALSIFFRSNDRNYELLQKHAGTRRKATWRDWLLLGLLFGGVLAFIAVLLIGTITVLRYAFGGR